MRHKNNEKNSAKSVFMVNLLRIDFDSEMSEAPELLVVRPT